MQKEIFYAVKMSDGMWQFGKSNQNPQQSVNESEFIKRKLEDFPQGREVRIFKTEQEWKSAQGY